MTGEMSALMLEEIFACPIRVWMSKHGLTERDQRFLAYITSPARAGRARKAEQF